MDVCEFFYLIFFLSNLIPDEDTRFTKCIGEICRDARSGDDATTESVPFSCPRLFEPEQNTFCCGNLSLQTYCCSNSSLTVYARTDSPDYPRNVVAAKVIVSLYGVFVLALMVIDWWSHRRIQKLKKSQKAEQ